MYIHTHTQVFVCVRVCVGVMVFASAPINIHVPLCLLVLCGYIVVCLCAYTHTLCHVLVLEHARQAYLTIVGGEEP